MKLGFLIHQLGTDQLGLSLISNINKLEDTSKYVFYEIYGRIPEYPNFVLMQSYQAWMFDGILISTTVDLTYKLLECTKASHKLFYVWNLEWLYNQKYYKYYQEVYTSDIDLIARSQEHASVIERCWKKPKYIVEDFHHEEIQKICKTLSHNK